MRRFALYPFRVGDNKTGQCGDCGLVFYGEGAFDRHRRGDHAVRRYCIDPSAAGDLWWRDGKGRWHHGRRRPRDTYEEAA